MEICHPTHKEGALPINQLFPDVFEVMHKFGLKPEKRLGQNFLIDQSALNKIIKAAGIEKGDTVLEIGPGLGSLTFLLAQTAHRVVAIELDERLIPALEYVLSTFENVEIIQGDILKINLNQVVKKTGYLVVANIPYYITSTLIRLLLEAQVTPRRMVLTVQNEVAKRICAGPGDFSLLSISVQVYGNPKIITQIPAGSFYPSPKVDSAVVCIDLFPEPRFEKEILKPFFTLAKAGFSQKRKNIKNSLSGGMRWDPFFTMKILEMAEIDPKRRAETLTLDEWAHLAVLTKQSNL